MDQETPDAPESSRLKVICAWCERIIRSGPGPVSHGVCDSCLPKVLAEVLQRTDPTSDASGGSERTTSRDG